MPISITPRESDIIESQADLYQSIINNLTSVLIALPAKFIYEIKMVPSVTLKDGTRVFGASHQVIKTEAKRTKTMKRMVPINPALPDGAKIEITVVGQIKPATYKTIFNRFMVMDIYILFEAQSRKKLTRIVLAPVNILKYKPQISMLNNISISVNNLISKAITIVGGDTSIIQPPTLPPTPTPIPIPTPTPIPTPISPPVPVTIPVVTPTPIPSIKLGIGALTLFEWYQAQGQTLPSVSARAITYEGFGLGPKGTYVGTTEQNDRLLSALKGIIPAPIPTPPPVFVPPPPVFVPPPPVFVPPPPVFVPPRPVFVPPPPAPAPTPRPVINALSYTIKFGDRFSTFTGRAINYPVGTVIWGTYSPPVDYGTSRP